MKPRAARKNIVVIGGGTGIHPVLRGLKEYWGDYYTTAIITMADSGGSTGRLRDEFGQLPVGDVRMALAALSEDVDQHDELLRELFLYRFDKGEGLDGHNFGNLLLVALTDMLGSESAAIKTAGRILRIRGSVVPVTADKVHLVATYDDGGVAECEHDIDEPCLERTNSRIISLTTEPVAHIAPDAKQAIEAADLILLGPGDLYASLFANCVVAGVPEAIQASKGKFVFLSNLMTEPGQTNGMKASDHVREVMKYVGRAPDTVIVNTSIVPETLLARYAESNQSPVEDDTDTLDCNVVKADLLSNEEVVKKTGDVLKRSLVRGDADKMAKVIIDLVP